MKRVYIVLLVLLVILVSVSVLYVRNSKSGEAAQQDMISPSEVFSGTIGGNRVVFKQKDYTKYQLQVNDTVTQGDLNTERGYESDVDATVYVLDWKKQEAEQTYYVRLTADPAHVQLLDAKRKIVPGALLVKVN